MRLTDPTPTGKIAQPKKAWPGREMAELGFNRAAAVDFWTVLKSRRSTRSFGPTSFSSVASIVRGALRIEDVGVGPTIDRFRGACLSAGALQSIEAIVLSDTDGAGPALYDAVADRWIELVVSEKHLLDAFKKQARAVLPEARGHWIALMADIDRVSNSYELEQSLAWRDAGAVLQTLALVSHASGFAFCPLGILGAEIVDAVVTPEPKPVAVGVAAIGFAR